MNKYAKRLALSLLFALVLMLGLSKVDFGQTAGSDQTSVVVPDQELKQVVRRVLIWSFKPRKKPTVVYLADQRIKESWLPTIKNINFLLLSPDEIHERNLEIYFFTEPELSGRRYRIGFAFGTLNCDYSGENWHFRITKEKVRLWQNGGVGGGCGISF